MPNKRACTFISGKVCPLTSIEPKSQTLQEINVHARLFGTLEYVLLLNKRCSKAALRAYCSNIYTVPDLVEIGVLQVLLVLDDF